VLGIGVCLAVGKEPAKEPGAKSDKEALPFWTKPDPRARKDLGTTTRSLSRGIVLLGYPKRPGATGWVLSARHRLIVTNAHVADLMAEKGQLFAIVNGTDQVHKVKRALYHPGVRRRLPGGKISIRSECPADGEVFTVSPDLAILELADGPALSTELPMATPDDLKNLFAQTVGMLGFPAHDNRTWPSVGEKAQGTYHDGVISRLTNFHSSVDAPSDELQFVQHTIQNFGGFSGSPIYLSNGRVVAVNNSGGPRVDRGITVTISNGIRVDCLWELLVHHKLDSKVAVPIDKSKLNIKRWLTSSEAEKRLLRAVRLVDEAANLIDFRQDYLAGVKKCDEAINLVPTYPDAYRVRCAGWNNYYSSEPLSQVKAREILRAAREDADQYSKLNSSDVRGFVAMANTANNVGALTRNNTVIKVAVANLDKVLSTEALPRSQRAELLSLRGVSHFNLRNRASAEKDFRESILLDPTNDLLYENRARFYQATGRADLAENDRASARAIRKSILDKLEKND